MPQDTNKSVQTFPDPGSLPAWNVSNLPDPPPFSIRSAIREIGPGVILVGAAIGSGEWLLGPALTAKYAGTNIAGFLLAVTALHTLYVNRRFLPPALQPRWWKQAALLACSGWYFFMSFMALDARVHTQVGFSIRAWLAAWLS